MDSLPSYSIDIHATATQTVGRLDTEAIQRLTGINLSISEVQMYPGAIKHIRRRHPGIIESYGHLIPEMISNPDYVGQNPKEPDSVELIKVVSAHLLLAIKLDPSGYLYLSTFYELDNGPIKLAKRLASGRLVPFVKS